MNDPYLSNINSANRLIKEWETHKKIIIAYDFDNTVYDFHGEGHTYNKVINLLRRCAKIGAYFIVFTARDCDKYQFIMRYLDKHSIPYDKINDDMEFISCGGGRKVYYNILLDDRAGLKSAYNILNDAALYMEEKLKDTKEDN